MDGRAVRDLCLMLLCPCLTLLCQMPGETAANTGGTTETHANVTNTYTRLIGHGTWSPLHAGFLPQSRFFFEDKTLMGRRIPGLAKWSRCCGIENDDTRIVGGSPTAQNQFPWMAALVRPGSVVPFCGGTLINDRYVVTAAHCVWETQQTPSELQVILGKHELTVDSGSDLRLDVDQVIVHPRFNDFTFRGDIALLKLRVSLALPIGDNLIAPICLPSRSIYFNERVETAGWGVLQEGGSQPDRLHSVQMRVISNALCGILNSPYAVTPDMVCAAGDIDAGGKDACQGDSGSPLMAPARYRRSRRVLLGVTSWGVGCARPRRPGVYARVPWFLDWLIVNTGDARYC